MVTRNRRLSTSDGYSRQHEKRDAERLVAEDLGIEPAGGNPAVDRGTMPPTVDRVVLDVGPRVPPRIDVDLRAVAHVEPARFTDRLLLLARRSGSWLWRVGRQFGLRSLRAADRQGRRLLAWISWK